MGPAEGVRNFLRAPLESGRGSFFFAASRVSKPSQGSKTISMPLERRCKSTRRGAGGDVAVRVRLQSHLARLEETS